VLPLREALAASTNPDVLRQAALGLGVLGNSSAVPVLIDLMRTTNNPFVASYAAIGVAFLGDADAAGPLLDLIRRSGPTGLATTYATVALGQLFDTDRRPALSRLAAGDNYLARTSPVHELLALGF
jgi:HEAT repeat protein